MRTASVPEWSSVRFALAVTVTAGQLMGIAVESFWAVKPGEIVIEFSRSVVCDSGDRWPVVK